jgi:4-diphosphocytidyl-2C-methyl-D-erythritol kinase
MSCSDTTLSIDGSNLVIKGLQLMRMKTGSKQCFKVHLDKHIPIQVLIRLQLQWQISYPTQG